METRIVFAQHFIIISILLCCMVGNIDAQPEMRLESPTIIIETGSIGKEKIVSVNLKIKTSSDGNLVFTDYNSLSPRISHLDGKGLITISEGTNASSVPSKANILELMPSKTVDIKAQLHFEKDQNKLYLSYYQASGHFFIFKIEPGTYSISFVYLVDENTSDLFTKSDVSSPALWHGKMTSNFIILQIK